MQRQWSISIPSYRQLTKALILITSIFATSTSFADTSFSFSSNSFIGAGQTQNFTTEDGTFSVRPSFGNDKTRGTEVQFDGGGFWTLSFDAANGEALSVGEYLNATRFPFNDDGVNGLSISGNGRGCNALTGSFEVLEIQYGMDGSDDTVEKFAADFVQVCDGEDGSLIGSIRFNSDIPVQQPTPMPTPTATPEPTTTKVTSRLTANKRRLICKVKVNGAKAANIEINAEQSITRSGTFAQFGIAKTTNARGVAKFPLKPVARGNFVRCSTDSAFSGVRKKPKRRKRGKNR